MKSIFISDAHIRDIDSPQQQILCQFLDAMKDGMKDLFILGDFFDFWFGFKEVVPYPYLPILSKLMELRKRGIRIVYFEGNHDFFMGPFFRDVLSSEVYSGEATLSLGGRKALLAHGDMADSKDYGYLLLRRLLRSRPFFTLAGLIPPSLLLRSARKLSGISRRFGYRNEALRGALRGYAVEKWKEGYEVVILSHSHTPEIYRDEEGRLYINTGDWLEHFTYLELEGDTFRLRRFLPSLSADKPLLQSVGP